MVRSLLLHIYKELYKSLFGISAHLRNNTPLAIKICVFAQIIRSWKLLLSNITIRIFCACTQKIPCAENPLDQ